LSLHDALPILLFIDASKDFVPGKNQNILGPEHIKHILDVFTQFHDEEMNAGVVEDKFAYIADMAEIRENDYNLNIPRYVDTFEEEPEVDIKAVQTEISNLKQQLAEVEAKMEVYLKELGV